MYRNGERERKHEEYKQLVVTSLQPITRFQNDVFSILERNLVGKLDFSMEKYIQLNPAMLAIREIRL